MVGQSKLSRSLVAAVAALIMSSVAIGTAVGPAHAVSVGTAVGPAHAVASAVGSNINA